SIMRMDATEEERAAIEERLGLNEPVVVRYGKWLVNAVQGDLGVSFSSEQPVMDRIIERFPATIFLTFWTIVLSILVGITFGVISANNRNTWKDHSINFGSVIGLSVPSFWLALM